MKSASAPEVFGPDFLQLRRFADQHRLHHAGGVCIRIQPIDAVQRHPAQSKDPGHCAPPAAPGQDARRGPAGHTRGPENLLPREIAGVIERSRVIEIARRPDARFDFDALAVFQTLQRAVVFERQTHAGPRARVEFERELLPSGREHGRLDHAAREYDGFPRPSVDLRPGSGTMPGVGENSHKDQRQDHTPAPQPGG